MIQFNVYVECCNLQIYRSSIKKLNEEKEEEEEKKRKRRRKKKKEEEDEDDGEWRRSY